LQLVIKGVIINLFSTIWNYFNILPMYLLWFK
jgi:hypothetical protein